MAERRIFENFIRPQIIDRTDPETAHDLIWAVAPYYFAIPGTMRLAAGKTVEDSRLRVTLGRNLPPEKRIVARSPVWMGAGVRKDGEGLEVVKEAGAGGVIVGAVVKEPQAGNDKPRLWRVGGKVANAFGFNSKGMVVVRANLEEYGDLGIPIVINVGKNKDTTLEDAPKEYGEVVEYMYDVADGYEICPSSPNTAQLRELQKGEAARRLCYEVRNAQEKRGGLIPTAIKAAPDIDEEVGYGLITLAHEFGFAISATNTTVDPEIHRKNFPGMNTRGGASGDIPAFRALADKWLEFFYREGGSDLEYWGGGGINLAEHAWRKIGLGADITFLVAGVAHKGLGIFNQLNRGLVTRMDHQDNPNANISYYRGRIIRSAA